MGYILKLREEMLWVDQLGAQGNPEAAKIKEDVCNRITKAMISLEGVQPSDVNCTVVSLIGHPSRAHLDISFNDKGRSVVVNELVEQLFKLFDSITQKTKDQRGPVAGEVKQHVVRGEGTEQATPSAEDEGLENIDRNEATDSVLEPTSDEDDILANYEDDEPCKLDRSF
ncbi:unnamed protein product [Dicrocoelium dendriticum]|nr:unnamed protein product [Dicrocoelium dendriticum]